MILQTDMTAELEHKGPLNNDVGTALRVVGLPNAVVYIRPREK